MPKINRRDRGGLFVPQEPPVQQHHRHGEAGGYQKYQGHAGGTIDQTQHPAEFDIPAAHAAAAGRHSSGQRDAEAKQRAHQRLGHNRPDKNGHPVILQNEVDLDQRGQRGQGDKKDERPVGHPPV